MKQLTNIGVLVFLLLVLIGCSSVSDLNEDMLESNIETTFPIATIDKVDSNTNDTIAATTIPMQNASEENTVPTVATTIVSVPTIVATTAPTVMPTIPIEADVTDIYAITEPILAQIPAVSAGFDMVYEDICCLLDTGSWDLEYSFVNMGMKELANMERAKEERYSSLTYALEDINNDGNLEMIVLDALGNSRILAVFALQNSQPVMTHEGWYRSRLYMLNDGSFYHEGSSGAAYSIFEAYDQCWFTYPKSEETFEVGFYYSADGRYDPAVAQEITADEYNAKQEELAQKIKAFSVYCFS